LANNFRTVVAGSSVASAPASHCSNSKANK
jgi:hypothetical protein